MEGSAPTLAGARGTPVDIRPADSSDAEQASPLIYDSGPEIWDYLFSGDAAEAVPALARLFADGRGPFGCRTCTVSETDGRVVGVVMFYRQADEQRLNRELVPQFLWLRGIPHRFRGLRRGMQMPSIMPPLGLGEGLLCGLAVDATRRGEGVGSRLIASVKQAAVAAGCEKLVLDVSSDNHRAQHLYERLGFAVTGRHEFSGPASAGIPAHLRMEKVLVEAAA
jgi:ribosomal protein S18 acetylase RimI-like enzyme